MEPTPYVPVQKKNRPQIALAKEERKKKYGNLSSNSFRNSSRINRIITNIKFSTFELNTMDI